MSKQELGHTQTPWKYDITDIRHPCISAADNKHIAEVGNAEDDADAEWEANAELIVTAVNERATLLSRVSQLESDCRMKDEALRHAEAVMSIVEPRSDKREYLECLATVRAALSPAPQPDAVQADETAWLIEFSEKVSRTPAYYGHTGEGLGETTDSLKAVRFARREDAQAIIDDIGWNEARPVEHMWTDSKCCNGLSPEECAQVPGRHCDGLQPASPPPADDVVEAAIAELNKIIEKPFHEDYYNYADGLLEELKEYASAAAAAQILSNAKKKMRAFAWLKDGRGSYDYDDDTWTEQFGLALLAFEKAIAPLHDIAGDLSDSPTSQDEIKRARTASAPVEAAGMPREAVEQLTNHQEQCDFDGVMVKVSRQALDEVLEYVRALPVPESPTDAAGLWASILALMERFRHERMVWHLNNRTDGFDPDATPDHLSREAEASAILALLPTDAAVRALVIDGIAIIY